VNNLIHRSRRFALFVFALSILTGGAHAEKLIKLSNIAGREIHAEVISLNDGIVEISMGGRRTPYPMDQLTEESQAAVKRALAERETKAAASRTERMQLPDGQPIVPRRLLKFTLQATDEDRERQITSDVKEFLVAVAFPENFDPDKPYPVFFVDDTTPGHNAKVAASYQAIGNEMGYVVLGAQAIGNTPNNKLSYWGVRGYSTWRAIQALRVNWPAITESDWYYGGSSGGGKNCCYLSVYLYETYKRPPSGLFVSAANEMKMLDAIKEYKSDRQAYKSTIVFVSNGEKDNVSKPEQAKRVADEFKHAGMREVRFELHGGGHTMNQPHYREALEWFTQMRKTP